MQQDLTFNQNEDYMGQLLGPGQLQTGRYSTRWWYSKDKKKQHEAGKLTARERIQYLLDADSPQFEMGHLPPLVCTKKKAVVHAGVVVFWDTSTKDCV